MTWIPEWLLAGFIAVTTAVASPATAQKKADEDTPSIIALKGGTIITVTGRTIRRGTVLMEGSTIKAVGDEVEIPDGAEVVDCRGKVVTPGFIPAVAWGVGLSARGSGFAAEEPDAPDEDRAGGHGHQPGASSHGGLFAHGHGPACLCSHLNWIYELQKPGMSALEQLRVFLPDRRLLAQASVLRLVTVAHPFLRGVSEQELFSGSEAAQVMKDNLDPYGRNIVLVNAAGITSTWLPGSSAFPVFAMILGTASPPTAGTGGIVIKLSRDRLEEMFVGGGRFLVIDLRTVVGNKRYTLLREIEDTGRYRRDLAAYEEARAEYKKAKARWKADKKAKKKVGPEPRSPKRPKKPSAAAKWLPLFERERALRVWAETVPQIRLALGIAERHGFELVIDDAVEGWAIAPEIARAGASVVLNPRRVVAAEPRRRRSTGAIYRHGSSIENAAILARHGVKVAVVPPAPAIVPMGIGGRDLLTFPLDAAFAMRGGLSRNEALKALTIHPAAILGTADRVGSLEPGKDADVLVLDGDPFDHQTFVERTYVNGRLVYEKDKEPLFDYVKRGKVIKPIWKWSKPGE
jgi:imidazolonepropionase-like amidohydrolase